MAPRPPPVRHAVDEPGPPAGIRQAGMGEEPGEMSARVVEMGAGEFEPEPRPGNQGEAFAVLHGCSLTRRHTTLCIHRNNWVGIFGRDRRSVFGIAEIRDAGA